MRGRTAQVRVRAVTAPQQSVCRVSSANEIITLQIQEVTSLAPSVSSSSSKSSDQAPTTWDAAMRTALGRDNQTQPPVYVPENAKINTRQRREEHEQHFPPMATKRREVEPEASVDRMDASSDDFEPWDLFADTQAEC